VIHPALPGGRVFIRIDGYLTSQISRFSDVSDAVLAEAVAPVPVALALGHSRAELALASGLDA
jgi:hypothetical protein